MALGDTALEFSGLQNPYAAAQAFQQAAPPLPDPRLGLAHQPAPAPAPAPPAPAAPAPVGVPYPQQPAAPAAPTTGLPLAVRPGVAGPSGYSPTTRDVTTKRGPFTEASSQAALNAIPAGVDVLQRQAEAEGAHGAVDAKAQDALAAYTRAQQIGDELRLRQHQAEIHDYARKVQALQDDAASSSVDPERYFHTRTALQSIGMVLGAGLTAAGAALARTGQDPMGIINHAVEHDIRAQEVTLQNKRDAAHAGEIGLARMKGLFGDDESARLALELQDRQWVAGQLQRQAADQTAPYDQRLRAAQLRQQVLQSIADPLQKLDERTVGTISEKQKYAQGGPGAEQLGTMVGGHFVPLSQLKALQETGIVPAAPKEQAETRKTLAEAQAAEAKAGAASPQAIAQKSFDVTSSPLLRSPENPGGGSTAITEHPLERLQALIGLQGTTGFDKSLDRDSYNELILATLKKSYGRVGSLEDLQNLAENYQIQPGDTERTITEKIARAKRNLLSRETGNFDEQPGAGTPED